MILHDYIPNVIRIPILIAIPIAWLRSSTSFSGGRRRRPSVIRYQDDLNVTPFKPEPGPRTALIARRDRGWKPTFDGASITRGWKQDVVRAYTLNKTPS